MEIRMNPTPGQFAEFKQCPWLLKMFKMRARSRRKRAEAAVDGLSDRAHYRGDSFDKEQGHPLSSKVTYRALSEELDMLNTHYLSHSSPKSWWNDKSRACKPSQQEEKTSHRKPETFFCWTERPKELPASRWNCPIMTACQEPSWKHAVYYKIN